jgi:hypothetical protein
MTTENGRLTPEQRTAAEFLGRHWPSEGNRNNAAGALAGGLLRAHWSVETTEAFIEAAAEAGGDEEPQKRVDRVAATAEALKNGKKTTGWPKLAKYLGKDGEKVVHRLRIMLGLTIDLERLAELKALPVQYLCGLGLHDLIPDGVGIPYRDGSGKTVAIKKRTAPAAKDGSYWPVGTPLMVYGEERLDEGKAEGFRVIQEGESDCWTLWYHKFPALGIPGSNTVSKTLQIGHVASVKLLYVIQEPDAAGTEFVQAVSNRLAEIGWTGELRVVRLDGAKDPSDLHKQDPSKFRERFQQALDRAEPVTVTASCTAEPLPTYDPPPWPEQPGDEAFHGLAGDIVRAIEPVSEADPAALLIQALVAFGNVVGRYAHFTVEGDRHHANEFVVLVGRSSKARKGTAWGRIRKLYADAEEQWVVDRIKSGLSSGEGLIWAVRDPIEKMERIKEKGEVRYEKVEADPGIEDKRLLALEPEFANVLKQTEQQRNILSATLRNAWDGHNLSTLTKNSPAKATGAHISLIGHITAEELRRYLSLTESANGFGNRHLWICTQRSKELPFSGCVDEPTWAALRNALSEAIAFSRTEREVLLDGEARGVWREVYGPLSAGRPGLAGALLGRAEAHTLRLAMIYALLDRSPMIGATHLIAATALWEYVERSVLHIFGDCLGDPLADELLRLIRAAKQAGLTRTDMSNYLNKNQPSDRIARALGLLLQHKLVRFTHEQTGGRSAERWFATTSRT